MSSFAFALSHHEAGLIQGRLWAASQKVGRLFFRLKTMLLRFLPTPKTVTLFVNVLTP